MTVPGGVVGGLWCGKVVDDPEDTAVPGAVVTCDWAAVVGSGSGSVVW